MKDCIFCKIIAGEIPAEKIYEDENFLAFLDIEPVNFGHTLVIPKQHFKNLEETPSEVLENLIKLIKKLAPKIKTATNADGFNVTNNCGESAGQSVMHLHFHIIPRFNNDNFKNWPIKKYANDEAYEIANKIKTD